MARNKKEEVPNFSRGMLYSNLLNSKNIIQKVLCEKLGISIAALNRYL